MSNSFDGYPRTLAALLTGKLGGWVCVSFGVRPAGKGALTVYAADHNGRELAGVLVDANDAHGGTVEALAWQTVCEAAALHAEGIR